LLAAKWLESIGFVPHHRFSTAGTFDDLV
jgi:hypothetical protein